MNNTGDYYDFINTNEQTGQGTVNENSLMDSIGRLKVFVFTGNAALPVTDAEIAVYTLNSAGDKNILYNLQSDYSGETEEVTLETYSVDNSMQPNQRAFASYYIDVDAPDFRPVRRLVVQIFPNTITVLPLNMQPQNGEV